MPNTIILTRAESDNHLIKAELINSGYKTISLPCVAFKEVTLNTEGLSTLRTKFDWIIFSSSRCVSYLHKFLSAIPAETKIACIGDKTAQTLADIFKRKANFIPSQKNAEQLTKELNLAEQTILLPTGNLSLETIFQHYSKQNKVKQVVCYNNVMPEFDQKTLDIVNQSDKSLVFVFYSPSAVENFIAGITDAKIILKRQKIIAVGKTTSSALENHELDPQFILKDPSQNLVEAISGFLK